MFRILTIAFLVTLVFTAPGRAQDLYSGEISVQGQGESERQDALPAALIQVLQKLSGTRELRPSPVLETALANAEGMVLSFHYTEHEHAAPDGEIHSKLRLVVNFSSTAADRIVRDLALPRWRQSRRPIVLWVVVDDGSSRSLKPLEFQYAWDAMEDVASMRGLPVAWPGLSEELQQQVDLQLLWGGYTEQLLVEGSDSDGVVIVAARREGPEWNVRWNYSDGIGSSSWRTRDRDLSFALVAGVHQLARRVALANSIAPSGPGEWQIEIRVAGLVGAADYARCLAYLHGLSLVDKVGVVEAGPDGIVFDLELNASSEYLGPFIRQDRVLEPGESMHDYRLLP